MNRINRTIQMLMVMTALLCVPFMSKAQTDADNSQPVLTFKTNIYDTYGTSNYFTLVIGTTDSGNYIDVDCGFGKVEYEVQQAVYDEETQGITGTLINCTVSSEGIVKIYGDAEKIDYFNASGCYIEWIEFPDLVNLDILDLSHNELKRIDLTNQSKLRALYLSDNTFAPETPLCIGKNKPELSILEVSIIDYMDSSFNLSDYPAMASFDGYHNVSLTNIDPSGCPELQRLTLDVTNVESIDVSKNPKLVILNVSETKVTSVDVSNNPLLRELYCSHKGSYNNEYKIETLDISNNPELVYLFCSGNKLTELNVADNENLVVLDASDNYLTNIDLSGCPNLYQVYLNMNCFDFVTLPENPGTWNTYYYGQREMEVDKSYPEGQELDFSSRVLRDDATTTAAVYAVSESNISEPVLLDDSYYSYLDGKITMNKEYADSVFVAFSNTKFDENLLKTKKFLVKKAADYGLPTKVFSFSAQCQPGENISFGIGADGATAENPVKFLVDFGDDEPLEFYAQTDTLPTEFNVVGVKNGYGNIEVYAPEGVTITAIDIEGIKMYAADFTKLASLRYLKLTDADLYSLDLGWNRCLKSVDLSGNNLSVFSLEGANGDYGKNVLSDINLSRNQLYSITLNDLRAVRNLDLSNNQLVDKIDFTNGEYIETINLSHNLFTEFDFTYCSSLQRLDVSDNDAASIVLPQDGVLENLICNYNNFTLADLPESGKLTEDNYIYAPQSDYFISTKGPGADLSSQNRIINGAGTRYTWKKVSGELLTEGVDYEINEGVTSFINTEMGEVYCEMTNAAFPAFAGENVYKTTPIEAAGMPTNVVASFKTLNDGDNVSLSLAAEKSGTAIYIDWKDDQTPTQYMLKDTYTLFEAVTKADTEVKVYTYEPDEHLSVFSMSGASLASFDGSKLEKAINISVNGAGLSEISLPEGSENLAEMSLENNAFESFDLSKFPALRTIALSGNLMTSIDLSKNKALEVVSVANNLLTEMTLDNDKIWALYIDHNEFEQIDLQGVPNLRQFSISNNYLTEIDVDDLDKLIMLAINNNNFTFETLPAIKDSYVIYSYGNQAPIEVEVTDCVVDLSSQRLVDDTETVYRWFVGVPSVDENTGELVGEELVLDTDYTLVDGVTTFLGSYEDVMCVMTNSKFPDVYMYTYLLDVSSVGETSIEDTLNVYTDGLNIVVETSETGVSVDLYRIDGVMLASVKSDCGRTILPCSEAGMYIVKAGNKSRKVIVI